ncbi:MAG: ribosome maturation factor RimP [Bacillota bacterium]
MREGLTQQIEELAAPACEQAGVELVEIESVREGGRWFLRLYIDKPGGVTLDDCQVVHEGVGRRLDENDPIGHPYTLEVASPGLDRPLKREADFERFAGEPVEVRTTEPVGGNRRTRGRLLGLTPPAPGSSGSDDPRIRVARVDGQVVEVPLSFVSRARLAPELDLPNGKRKGGGRR